MEIRLNGKCYADWKLLEGNADNELYSFLREWHSDCPYVVGHTSGSTGKPKKIHLLKEDMRASARITNEFLGITSASVLLLCLSVSYIAGKMMVVRALESGAALEVVEVSSHPLRGFCKPVDLAAMVPMQVEASVKVPEEKAALGQIRKLLIGGAPVSSVLEEQLHGLSTACFATYGMTETVSHVALKKLNSDREYFALGQVRFSLDERGCLIIFAPHLQTRQFITNDVVKWVDSTHFEWLGRYDNVINSGGLKFYPEVMEHKIASIISRRFFITSQPDEFLGQRVVLVIENESPEVNEVDSLRKKLRQVLTPYEMPGGIFFCPKFSETASGKVIRKLEH